MICHHYKCIFVHIPKTGGQSIEHVFLDLLGLTWETRAPLLLRHNENPDLGPPRLAHLRAHDYVRYKYLTREQFDGYFKFAFVRNPWDRFLSIYKYLNTGGEDFRQFGKNFKSGLWKREHWFVRPQSDFVCNDNGELLVDFVGRFESLQEDFDRICGSLGLPPMTVPHKNKSEAKRPGLRHRIEGFVRRTVPGARGRPVRLPRGDCEPYDEDLKALVADLYRRDIELFGYRFPGESPALEKA
jgi:hypothetical protein